MTYGSPALRQHVVEFIVGTGVVTDGITDAAPAGGGTTVGPWVWTVPLGVAQITIDACGAGAGGGGGGSGGTSLGGGSGGTSGIQFLSVPASVVPNASLTVTVASAGTGGAVNANGTSGGTTTIAGLLKYGFCRSDFGSLGRMEIGGSSNGLAGASTTGSTAAGGGVRNTTFGTAGYTIYANRVADQSYAGGAGNASASVAGASGGVSSNQWFSGVGDLLGFNGAAGDTTTGPISRGGGGLGGTSYFGYTGKGGVGGVAGSNAGGFGAGGGGGGGGAAGGNGAPGYVRFTYWSQD